MYIGQFTLGSINLMVDQNPVRLSLWKCVQPNCNKIHQVLMEFHHLRAVIQTPSVPHHLVCLVLSHQSNKCIKKCSQELTESDSDLILNGIPAMSMSNKD